jgi:hypothetical protein
MQSTVDHRMVDRTAHGGLIGRLHRGHHEHATSGGLLEKRSQQFLFLLQGEILAMTASRRFSPQHGLALTKIVGMQLPHRAHLPAQSGGNLRGTETQSSSQPHTLNALVIRLAFRLVQHRCQALGGSVG